MTVAGPYRVRSTRRHERVWCLSVRQGDLIDVLRFETEDDAREAATRLTATGPKEG